MIYQEGYVYHIKDEYFEKVRDSNLMQNKEGGTYHFLLISVSAKTLINKRQ